MKSYTVTPNSKVLRGSIEVAGDKSISHRALIFGALASGTTTIQNMLEGEDVLCTAEILKNLGVTVVKVKNSWKVVSPGISGLQAPKNVLYCGNSGTTLRLMTGFFSGLPFTATLTGDPSLNKRPMGRVMEPLTSLGAKITEEKSEKGRFITVQGGQLHKGSFSLKIASAQLKTALLLAGLTGDVEIRVKEPLKSRDHSERMLKAFGAKIRVRGLEVGLARGSRLKGQKFVVPCDISSAAFFIVAALIHRQDKTRLTLENIGVNPTRTGLLDVLKKMGAKIQLKNKRLVCGEPVADLVVRPSSLKGVSVPRKLIPSLIDEIPILSVAAAMAKGVTRIRGAEELRVKETDRIKALVAELPKFGVKVKEYPDGLDIIGLRGLGESQPLAAVCESYGDHRIAMSTAVLASVAQGPSTIRDTECVATSFPNFRDLMEKVGFEILEKN